MINSMSLPCNGNLKEDRSHREAVFFFLCDDCHLLYWRISYKLILKC
jgi:hypothetical protein